MNPPDLPEPIVGPYEIASWLPLLLVILFFLLVAGVVLWIILRSISREAQMMPSEQPAAPPREEAMARLSQLEKELEGMDARTVAAQLTEIIKHFLERQYGVGLKSHTTDEYYTAVQEGGVQVPQELAQGLANLFTYLDALKFQSPEESAAHKQQILEQATLIVQAQVQPAAANAHG